MDDKVMRGLERVTHEQPSKRKPRDPAIWALYNRDDEPLMVGTLAELAAYTGIGTTSIQDAAHSRRQGMPCGRYKAYNLEADDEDWS